MDYAQLHESAFRSLPDSPPGWIHFPFAWGTPEAQELQTIIWKIDSQMWKAFLTTVHDENIEGDLLEFGVSGGNSLGELIQYAEELGLHIKVYGFDSFEGLPEPSARDAAYWHKGQFSASYASVAHKLKLESRPNVSLIKGWFSDTLIRPDIEANIRRVAFARIDCDLYEPAVECLSFLENRLADGSYLCFDDWTDNPETGETRAFFEFFERTKHKFRFQLISRISLGGMHMRVFHI